MANIIKIWNGTSWQDIGELSESSQAPSYLEKTTYQYSLEWSGSGNVQICSISKEQSETTNVYISICATLSSDNEPIKFEIILGNGNNVYINNNEFGDYSKHLRISQSGNISNIYFTHSSSYSLLVSIQAMGIIEEPTNVLKAVSSLPSNNVTYVNSDDKFVKAKSIVTDLPDSWVLNEDYSIPTAKTVVNKYLPINRVATSIDGGGQGIVPTPSSGINFLGNIPTDLAISDYCNKWFVNKLIDVSDSLEFTTDENGKHTIDSDCINLIPSMYAVLEYCNDNYITKQVFGHTNFSEYYLHQLSDQTYTQIAINAYNSDIIHDTNKSGNDTYHLIAVLDSEISSAEAGREGFLAPLHEIDIEFTNNIDNLKVNGIKYPSVDWCYGDVVAKHGIHQTYSVSTSNDTWILSLTGEDYKAISADKTSINNDVMIKFRIPAAVSAQTQSIKLKYTNDGTLQFTLNSTIDFGETFRNYTVGTEVIICYKLKTGYNKFYVISSPENISYINTWDKNYVTSGKNEIPFVSNIKGIVAAGGERVIGRDSNFTYDYENQILSVPKITLNGKDIETNYATKDLATTTTKGLVRVGFTTDATKRNYKVEIDSNGDLYVNVPWTDSVVDAEGNVKLDDYLTINSASTTYLKIATAKREYATLIPYGTQITANANLNTTTYIKVGNYYCSANTTVATLQNCPTTKAFMMQVLSPLATTIDNETTNTYVYRLRKIQTYTGDEYIQYVSSGATAGTFTYGAWKQTARTSDIPTKATSSALGLVKIGYTASDKNYPVELNENGQMYVNVPWENTNTDTTYDLVGAKDTTGLVKNGSSVTSTSGLTACPIIGGVPYYKDTNTTSFLPLSGGTVTGTITMQATTNANSANLKWGKVNSKTPYFGYASDQADGTFVWSITGTEYATGLAIGGGSGNLLWKGTKVATISDITDTKNTTGSTNKTGTKMFLVGATTQADNPVTYSNSNVYIDSGNRICASALIVDDGTSTGTVRLQNNGANNTAYLNTYNTSGSVKYSYKFPTTSGTVALRSQDISFFATTSSISTTVNGTVNLSTSVLTTMSTLNTGSPKVGDIVISSHYSSSYANLRIGYISALSGTTATIKTTYVSTGKFTCVAEGTMITMADGTKKKVEEVKEGELLRSVNLETGETEESVCLFAQMTTVDAHLYYLMFDNGSKLRINWTHDIYNATKKTWVKSDCELDVGDMVLDENGNEVMFIGPVDWVTTQGSKQVKFYNIISSNNCYYADGILMANNPITQAYWLEGKYDVPQDLIDLVTSYKDETNIETDLMENEEYFNKHMLYIGDIMKNKCRMGLLKNNLTRTDYVAIKQSEGIEVDQEIINNRASWRQEYNEIEIKQRLLEQEDNKLKAKYSSLGEDILLPTMELRAKLFTQSCRLGRKNFENFKKYYTNSEHHKIKY